ncbi:MAG: helicase-exonuclease AddAB subunit AddA [Lachnospiraceae bacterium]|nr:helicase-exonuclease AddAB subunit AddA [Lachnospiraceae bacterium]
MGWTKEQLSAIEKRKSNILVSAAAGSGKTAVLVERIINKMTDKENPKDIDEFLVVTFTKAAAAQMREKIALRIEKMLAEEPDNEHLMRQAVLVNRADITTIDSFCLRVVKENFGLLSIDANFNIGDTGMMALIKNDVLDALFDRLYEEKNSDFFMLLDIFGDDRNDDNLKKSILKIYNLASSYPRPYVWLNDAKAVLSIKNEEELMELNWIKDFFGFVKSYANSALFYAKYGRDICEADGGPDKNLEVSKSDIEDVSKIIEAENYDDLKNAVDIKWARLKTCKGDAYDEELVEHYKNVRENYKKIISKLKIFKGDSHDLVNEIKNTAGYLIPLIDLVIDFSREYEIEKGKRKLVEFSDVEHMAYQLVCDGYDKDGKPVSTDLAKRISEKYDEIFIDEYQDSNYLQEDILYSVSGISYGKNNMFMVGDVKQSIYKFRMARPDLFVSKYNTFSDDGPEVKIELKNNFRSRENVLNSINYFCKKLIRKDLGGIEYDESVALVPTKEFPVPDENIKDNVGGSTEVILVDNFETDERLSKLELEAVAIAGRIKELVGEDHPQFVYDEEKDIYRKASYRDIVILARSLKEFGDVLYNTLTMSGIPAYLEDTGGYFEAVEIKLIMSLLSIVDNIKQDIPLAAVLLSPMAKLDENELSFICDYAEKKLKKKHLLYDKCLCYMEDVDDYISDKLKNIFNIVDTLRLDNKTMSISSLIWKALDMTGYYSYVSAMPMGGRRKNNINLLLEKAEKFENGSYKGLFNFLRYLEKLQINEVDFGEAKVFGDDEDVVRIITMHKSKGLEYPVVFVSGLGKQFNSSDSKEQLIIHSDYYLASDFVDIKDRFKKNTFIKDVFKLLIKKENMAEELRVLYVALTRAKEKLIITGCDKDIDKIMAKLMIQGGTDESVPFDIRYNASGFLTWIIACMNDYNGKKDGCDIELKILREEDISGYIGKEEIKKAWSYYDFYEKAVEKYDKNLYDEYKKSFEFIYPYAECTKIKSKMSISEIKKMKAFDGTEYEAADDIIEEIGLINESDEISPDEESSEKNNEDKLPSQRNNRDDDKNVITGAQRGTIVHKFMELLNFKDVDEINEKEIVSYLNNCIDDLKKKEIFSDEEAAVINPFKVRAMLLSNLGKRMIKADKLSLLNKEMQFSAGLPIDMIYNNDYDELSNKTDVDDIVVVQGIIDAYFYEDDKIILMDYKTDHADEEELIGRYKAQLDYYAYVLEKITGLIVDEKIIYSFYLEKEIELD